MTFATYLKEIHRSRQSETMRFLLRIKKIIGRKLEVVDRVGKPTFIERARKLGYKAKQGFTTWSVRIRKGDAIRKANNGNTRGKCVNAGIHQIKHSLNKQAMAEQLAGKRLGSLRVLGSYKIGSDARFHFFEVLMVDPMHNAIRNDYKINWICTKKHREMRGITSAGRKSRGLGKGIKYNNTIGGSTKSAWKKRNTLLLRKVR